MANYFSLTLDTLAPSIASFAINSGATVTTNRTVTLAENSECEEGENPK